MNRPADFAARQQALDPERSFAVSAPAGSGKTGLLTQRVLKLLAGSENPEEVLCITFTRKAAGEMAERIIGALEFAASHTEPAAEHERLSWQLAQNVLKRDRELNWQLLDNPSRLRILTIDGLCRQLARQLPLTSGLGALPDTLDDPSQAYREAVREFFQQLDQSGQIQTDLLCLLSHLDNNLGALEDLLVSLLERRDQWLGHLLAQRGDSARKLLEHNLDQLYREHIQLCRTQLNQYASDLALAADFAGNNLRERDPDNPIATLAGISCLPDDEPNNHPVWLALCQLLLTNSGSWRSRLTKNEGYPSDGDKAFKALVKERKRQLGDLIDALRAEPELLDSLTQIRILPPVRYAERQWQLLDSLTRLLPLLAAQLRLSFQRLGATDFSEITQAALQALGDDEAPGDALLKLDYRIRHILVDEFQDTASPQLQLLERLTCGWELGDGRTLFIVGDGMQSCYGFRDANVGIFLDAHSKGIGTVPLTSLRLEVNFRSQQGVVDWVNQSFKQAFPARDDISRGAVCYADSIAFKPRLDGAAVECHICTDRDNDKSRRQQLEARQTLELVQRARATNPDETVAILVRTRSHLREVLRQLREAGLSWQATEIDPLLSRMAIIDLLSMTRALHNPGDRISWLALLRSPLIGLSLSDLLALSSTTDDAPLPLLCERLREFEQLDNLSTAGRQALARAAPAIIDSLNNTRRQSLRAQVQGLWLQLGGPAALLDPSDIDNCNSFFDLLERCDRGARIEDWTLFEQQVAKLYARPRDDADPKLQVMTIHKSKGLEFDTVIIPGLDRRPRGDDKALLLWHQRLDRQGQMQLLLGPLAPSGEDADPLYQYLRQEANYKTRLEATRLLYVGCTRAIKRLHLIGCANINDKDDSLKPPAGESLLASIWPSFSVEAKRLETSVAAAPEQQSTTVQQPIVHLPPDWQAPAFTANPLLEDYRNRYEQEPDSDNPRNLPERETQAQRLARHTGTLLHRVLEQVVREGIDNWTDARIERQRPIWRSQLAALGVLGAEQVSGAERIEQLLRNCLSDNCGRWLLGAHEQAACELGLLINGKQCFIDRTFVDQGCRWIIDYKSSEPDREQSLESFLEQECDSYYNQLKGYAQAIQAIDTRPVRTALYFPALQHLQEVELQPIPTAPTFV